MANGRRYSTRANPTRRNGAGAPRRTANGRRGPTVRANGYRDAPPGPAGMHPAVIVGLIAVPLILVVAVVILLATGGSGGEPAPEPVAAYVPPPTPSAPPVRRRPVERPHVVPKPSKGEMDMLERQWAPLRDKVQEMKRLRDEGTAAWRDENHELMQDKFHEAADIWADVRDTAASLLGRFTEEQVDKYLGDYEREQIVWRRIWASFQKSISVDR